MFDPDSAQTLQAEIYVIAGRCRWADGGVHEVDAGLGIQSLVRAFPLRTSPHCQSKRSAGLVLRLIVSLPNYLQFLGSEESFLLS